MLGNAHEMGSNVMSGDEAVAAHVLVVDDEKAIRTLLAQILGKRGLTVTMCADGATAVSSYAENHHTIDLVFLDLVMPDMSGLDVMRAFKEINPSPRVILCSGYMPDLEGKTVAQHGFLAFLAKPFGVKAVLKMIDRHVEA